MIKSRAIKPSLNRPLTHWGWVTNIRVCKLTIIGSDKGLSAGWHQSITWTNAGSLSIGLMGTHFSEIWCGIPNFYSRKCFWKCRLPEWLPFCPDRDESKPPQMKWKVWVANISEVWWVVNDKGYAYRSWNDSHAICPMCPLLRWMWDDVHWGHLELCG